MLSLAAFRYRNVLSAEGGPIERLEMSDATVLGQRQVLANAYLREGLTDTKRDNLLYSPAHGSGTASSPMVARFMAISEAMERWAYWQRHAATDGPRYGFDVDPSSNGMAAFPGVFARQARSYARLEAAERFNVLNWWEGNLDGRESDTRWPGVRAVTITSAAPGVTVILFRRTDDGFYSYGHAGGKNFAAASQRAAGEMDRHERVVARFARNHGGQIQNSLPPDAHPIERRTLFFAHEEGHARFLERLRAPAKGRAVLKLVYDGPIPGPWSKYADVWRVVYAPPSRRFLGTDETYFML